MNQRNLLRSLILSVIFCSILQFMAKAQEIKGIIKDISTNQPVGFSNILLANTPIGSSADRAG